MSDVNPRGAVVSYSRIFWPVLCALLVAGWESDWHHSSTVMAYFPPHDGEQATRTLFAANAITQKVTAMDVDNMSASTFDKCTVIDARNWRCEFYKLDSWPMNAYVVTDGVLTVTDSKHMIQPTCWVIWQWYSLFGRHRS